MWDQCVCVRECECVHKDNTRHNARSRKRGLLTFTWFSAEATWAEKNFEENRMRSDGM